MSKLITLDNLKSALTKFKENLSPSLAKLDSITGVVTADKLQNPDHPTDLVAYEAFQAAVPLVRSMNITGAQVGQTIKVKAVNEQGMPTAWEAADMQSGEASFPKFEKLITHTITEEEIAANPAAFVWGTAQIPNLNDFNVFTLTIRNPDDTTKITFTKWVRLKINNVLMGNICGTNQGEGYKYSISANRLYGFWVSDNMYNPNNNVTNVLTPPYSRQGFDSNLAASEAVTSIGFTSYNPDYGLTAGIIVEIWGAK